MRWPVPTSTLALGGSFALPVAVVAFFFARTELAAIELAERELLGCRLVGAVGAVQADLLEAPLARQVDSSAPGRTLAHLPALTAEHAELQQALGLLDLPPPPPSLTELEGVRRYGGQLNELVRIIGDRSGLVLDPDHDSYYLMRLIVSALPDAEDHLLAFLAKTPEDPANARTTLATLLAEADLPLVLSSARGSLEHDPAYHGPSPSLVAHLPPLLAQLAQAAQDLQVALGGATTDLEPAARAYVRAMADLHQQGVVEEQALLGMRLRHLRGELRASLLLSALAVAAAAAMAWKLTRLTSEGRVRSEEITRANQELRTREAELEQRAESLGAILDSVSEGLLTMDFTGTIGAERSARANELLGLRPGQDANLAELTKHWDPHFHGLLLLGLWQFQESGLWDAILLDQMPRQLTVRGRRLALRYQLRAPAGGQKLLLVVLRDVTEEEEALKRAALGEEALQILRQLQRDRAAFVRFLAEGRNLVSEALSEEQSLPTRLRALHTLKGSAALFGVHSIAQLAHRMEEVLREPGSGPLASRAESAELVERWTALERTRQDDGGDSNLVAIDTARLQELRAKLRQCNAPSEVQEAFGELHLTSTQPWLERLAEEATRLAERLGKRVDVHVSPGAVRVAPERWAPLAQVMIHLLRNAVDHGVERPEGRVAHGKPELARLELATAYAGEDILITVKDDGQGVPWDRVRQRAEGLGLPCTTAEELQEALLSDGLSTAERVTEISGRGIGVGAVRAHCRSLGGDMRVESKPGQGTLVACRVPRQALQALTSPSASGPESRLLATRVVRQSA